MNHIDLVNTNIIDYQAYTEHHFVNELFKGSLKSECFVHYLKQDYLFLKHYARCYALAVYKAQTLSEMRESLGSLNALLGKEIQLHVSFCKAWGLDETDLDAVKEEFGTIAYTRYVLDIGMAGNLTELLVALSPCTLGYADIGRRYLLETKNSSQQDLEQLKKNPYQPWLNMYTDPDFLETAEQSMASLDKRLANIELESEQGQRLCHIFNQATRMEIAFWEQGLSQA